MGIFGKSRIEGDEREKCLTYYEASFRLTAFWDKESDLFNNTLVKYLDCVPQDPVAASKVQSAANRLVQAAHETIRRHEAITPVPAPASAAHLSWHVTYLAIEAWAKATLSAMEALAHGMVPQYGYVQHLIGEYQSAQHRAQDQDKRLLKQLNVTANEMETVTLRATRAGTKDTWEPNERIPDLCPVDN